MNEEYEVEMIEMETDFIDEPDDTLDVIEMMGMDNIADVLDEAQLREIGSKAKEGY